MMIGVNRVILLFIYGIESLRLYLSQATALCSLLGNLGLKLTLADQDSSLLPLDKIMRLNTEARDLEHADEKRKLLGQNPRLFHLLNPNHSISILSHTYLEMTGQKLLA